MYHNLQEISFFVTIKFLAGYQVLLNLNGQAKIVISESSFDKDNAENNSKETGKKHTQLSVPSLCQVMYSF